MPVVSAAVQYLNGNLKQRIARRDYNWLNLSDITE